MILCHCFLLTEIFDFTLLQNGSTSCTYLLFIVFLCSMIVGATLPSFLRKRDDKEGIPSQDSSISFCSSLVSQSKLVIGPLFDTRVLLIIPLSA